MTKQEMISYYEDGIFELEVKEILLRAKEVVDSTENLERYAAVFDIDDTSFNHYQALKLVNFPQDDNHQIWHDLISSVDVISNKPVLEFYHYCINKGLKVFFISARLSESLNTTKQALEKSGYVGFEDVFVFPKDILEYNPEDFKSFKLKQRKYIESLGYKILLCLGDQKSDFEGGHSLNSFLIPNFLYGSRSYLKI